MKNRETSILDFLFEVGHLKQRPRSGWFKTGVDSPESIGEHSFRTAVIGFVLASDEGVDVTKATFCCLFHDLAETRTSDLDWLAQNYLEKESYLDEKILKEQISGLPEKMEKNLSNLLCLEGENEKIKKVVRDADLLEAALQGIEYLLSGNRRAREWIKSSIELLSTESGKKLGEELDEGMENDNLEELSKWWDGLIDQRSIK